MHAHELNLRSKIEAARIRHTESLDALEKVRQLLAKADARCRQEPADVRKWHRVLENLEENLDESKKRVELASMELLRLEQELAQSTRHGEASAEDTTSTVRNPGGGAAPEEALTLEEKSRLQAQLMSGDVCDKSEEARLELANQLGEPCDDDASGQVPRRQLVLRRAIDKISQRQFEAMSYEEIKLVLACHSLLTSRLEPTGRDQRLKRVLDGAVKVLRRRKAALEGA